MCLRMITNPLLKGRSGVAVTAANALVNWGAVGFSTSLNVYFMRKSEMDKGINVVNPKTGEKVGVSKKAAEQAITQTITTRWIYLVPIFFTAPILQALFTKMKMMPKGPGAIRTVMDLAFVTTGLMLAIPTCCAIFPQMSNINVASLEEDLQVEAKKRGLDYLQYNKGI